MCLLKMFFFILCEIIFDYEETSGVLWVKGSSGTWIRLNYRMVLKDSQNIVDIFLPLLMQVKSFYNTVIKMPYGD